MDYSDRILVDLLDLPDEHYLRFLSSEAGSLRFKFPVGEPETPSLDLESSSPLLIFLLLDDFPFPIA